MNKTLVKCGMAMVAAVLAVSSFAQDADASKPLPMAEARANVGAMIKDPEALTAAMKQMSSTNQVAFVAEVNAAISKMPGSNEEKAAAALNANKALLKGASAGNVANVLAEVFASAPVETLGLISENFASDLFNRDADPSRTYSDAEFSAIAEAMVKKIVDRTSSGDDGGVRSAFGVMMMVNASNGSPADLPEKLSALLPEDVRDVARDEWIPDGIGENKNYEGAMAYSSEAGTEPNATVALQLAGPQMLDAMLSDVASGMITSSGDASTDLVDQAFGRFGENVINATDSKSNSTMNDPGDGGSTPVVPIYQFGEM